MATLNDYKAWLNEVDLNETEFEATSQLVHSLRNHCESGLFKTVLAKGENNGWIVSAVGTGDALHLTTPKQVSAFIRHIEDKLCDGMDAEVYASYKYYMMKED